MTVLNKFPLYRVLLVLLGLLAFGPASAITQSGPSSIPRSTAQPAGFVFAASTVPGDTLSFEVRAGTPFVANLPKLYQGRPIRYEPAQLPALAWLVDYALLWKTLPEELGVFPMVFLRFDKESGVEAAPLTVLVSVYQTPQTASR